MTDSLPPANELLRQLGLFVDGPARWASPVNSRKAGVFVVELPRPLNEPRFDERALRRWIEEVPSLRRAGARPTPRELAEELAAFWLPTEPVLYVGRSAKSLASRVAALYATPLGASRPHPGGHWLKALANLAELRLWWAETEAHEEYADALLTAIAERQPADLRQRMADQPLLPFANLADSAGRARQHGLSGSLAEPAEPGPAAAPSASKPATSAKRPRASGPRQPARSRKPAAAKPKPKVEPNFVSGEGLARLEQELEQLRNEVRPGVIARVKAARELGDLRENAEYESARKEQSFVEGRIQALEALIKAAVVVEADASSGAVAIGSTVVVETDGHEETYQLVGSSEADPAKGRISHASPVGQALLGRRVGEEAVARLPRGELRFTVRDVR